MLFMNDSAMFKLSLLPSQLSELRFQCVHKRVCYLLSRRPFEIVDVRTADHLKILNRRPRIGEHRVWNPNLVLL